MCGVLIETDSSILIDPRERSIGEENRTNISRLLGTLALYPFERRLGMSFEETQVLVAQARAEAANPNLKAYFPL